MSNGTLLPRGPMAHEHDHGQDTPSDLTLRVKALESLLVEKGLVDPVALDAIADVVRRHDLVVVSDEIYDRLSYDAPHVPFATLPGMLERTLLLNGFSKTYGMTGWRVG